MTGFCNGMNRARNRYTGDVMGTKQKMGHDLKQPLTTLRTFIRHIETKKNDEEFMKEFSNYVPKALDRIEEIANQLLQMETK